MFDCISFECIKRLIFWNSYKRRRILSEDLLILILDYLPIDDMIELMKVSKQFSNCVKELTKRKLFLVVFKSREDYLKIFHSYHKNRHIRKNLKQIKDSVIPFEAMKVNEKNKSLKFVSKRCIHLNVLSINHSIKDKQIKALNKFSKRIVTLSSGSRLLSSGNLESIETKIEKTRKHFQEYNQMFVPSF